MKTNFTILFLILFSGFTFAQNKIETGKKTPEITMSKPDGTPFSLSSLKGNWFLLTFGLHGVLLV